MGHDQTQSQQDHGEYGAFQAHGQAGDDVGRCPSLAGDDDRTERLLVGVVLGVQTDEHTHDQAGRGRVKGPHISQVKAGEEQDAEQRERPTGQHPHLQYSLWPDHIFADQRLHHQDAQRRGRDTHRHQQQWEDDASFAQVQATGTLGRSADDE